MCRARLGGAAARGSTGQAGKDVHRDKFIVVSRMGLKKAEEVLASKGAEQKHHKRLLRAQTAKQSSKQQQPVWTRAASKRDRCQPGAN